MLSLLAMQKVCLRIRWSDVQQLWVTEEVSTNGRVNDGWLRHASQPRSRKSAARAARGALIVNEGTCT
jgi:hypothetical protein